MTAFSHPSPFLKGNYAPVPMEMNAPILEVVEGKIPKALNGVFYRNGVNPMYPPLGDHHHWFLSEGMIHAIRLQNGRASYKNRWVKTRQYDAQLKAGKRLFSTSIEDPSLPEAGDVRPHYAATHVVVHAGKLLALDEWNGPAALDPLTLETTIPYDDFGGKHIGAFTAHPKLDPKTGEMLGFGYQAAGPGSAEMSFTVVNAKGQVTRHDHFPVPFCSIAHDFAITDEHVIFPLFSADIDLERAAAGGVFGGYNPGQKVQVGIMRRDGDVKDIRWFTGPATYAFHSMNAYTEKRDGRTVVVMDLMTMPGVPLFPNVETRETPFWLRDIAGRLVRWTFDLDGNENTYTEEVITDLLGDFCTVDERYVGQRYKIGFFAGVKHWKDGAYFDTVAQIDVTTHERRDYTVPEGCSIIEPIFVPRSKTAPEGDGWLLTIVYDEKRGASELYILDTKDIRKGPIARVAIPTRIPFGFHGSWHGVA